MDKSILLLFYIQNYTALKFAFSSQHKLSAIDEFFLKNQVIKLSMVLSDIRLLYV